MHFTIEPYVGISPSFVFSMNKSSVSNFLGNKITKEFVDEEWGIYQNVQYCQDIGLHIHYDKGNIVEQFGILRPSSVTFQQRNLLDFTYIELLRFIKSYDKKVIETDAASRCIYSFKFGFYTYSELSDNPNWKSKEKIAMVGVFRQGMHADVKKRWGK